jgi:plastocyanin
MEQSAKPPGAPKPKSKTMFLVVIIVAILVVVGVGAYILLQKSTTAADYTITIYDNGCSSSANCGFKDASGSPNITIAVGKTVQWKNTGTLPHTATSCDPTHASGNSAGCPVTNASGLPSFDTGDLSSGQTSSVVTFSQAGTYYYYCSVHPNFMHGVIIVQ